MSGYVSVAEMAEMAGVTQSCVSNWRARGRIPVKPLAELRMGPIYDRDEIAKWLSVRVRRESGRRRVRDRRAGGS